MSLNFRRFEDGLELVPKASTTVSIQGEFDVTTDGNIHFYDGTTAQILANISGTQTFTNKSISGSNNTLTNIPGSAITGTVSIANGGTGQTTASAAFNTLSPITAAGDLIIGSGVDTATNLPIGTNGQILTVVSGLPSWQTASGGTVTSVTASSPLASSGGATPNISLTGIVSVSNGGTGLGTLTANNVILGNGTSNPLFVAPGTSGNVLTSNGTTWISSAGAITGANQALSNLSAVAINTSLLPGVTGSIDLGSPSFTWRNQYIDGYGNFTQISTPSTPSAGSNNLYFKAITSPVTMATSGGSQNSSLDSSSPVQWVGQSFQSISTATISSCTLSLKYLGGTGITGTMVLALYSDSSGSPGTLLASSGGINASTVTTSYSTFTFTFTSGPSLTASTTYHVALIADSIVYNGGVLDVATDNTNPYASGNAEITNNAGGSWTSQPSSDLIFTIAGSISDNGKLYTLNSVGVELPVTQANGFAFFASSQVTTNSSAITSGTFTTFSNSPALTFTPTITGKYKVYCSIPLYVTLTGGSEGVARIFNTSGSASLLYESQVVAYGSTAAMAASGTAQSVYTLNSGTSYQFDIQGKAEGSSPSLEALGGDAPFYLFAELCG